MAGVSGEEYIGVITPEYGDAETVLPLMVFAERACMVGCNRYKKRIDDAARIAEANPGVQVGVVCRKNRIITSGGNVVKLGHFEQVDNSPVFIPSTHPENGWDGPLEDVEYLVSRGVKPTIFTPFPSA